MATTRSRACGLLAMLVLALLGGCQPTIDWVHDLENGDYSKVRFQKAPASLQPFTPTGDDETYVAIVQNYFAEHQPLLNTLAAQCPSVEESSLEDFKLQSICTEPNSGCMMVQFFARYEHPRIFAGRRVQFVLTSDRQLDAIYVHDTPLEQ
ncbi:MAG TPA: hypothetical protein VMF29_04815 [Candidatus Edwardsbacteria bacterium]|nr:hypothetical protein [Candidatus Edwardsbacteria bacterium]